MLLILDDVHKNHLQLLKDVDSKVAKEFCKIAVEHLHKGTNAKIYQSAAQRLNVDVEMVQRAVDGVMYLFTEAAKTMIGELEFRDSILLLGFAEESQNALVSFYLENQKEIRALLTSLTIDVPHYHNLEWRLDVQVASRSLRRPLAPEILLSLDLENEGKITNHILQTDPVNLIHMAEVLDQALQELKSQHCRRIMRSIK